VRNLSGAIAIAALLLSATASFAAPVHGKGHLVRRRQNRRFESFARSNHLKVIVVKLETALP
jgi:hypothetical protein